MENKKLSFVESLIIIILMFVILGFMIIKLEIAPQIPLLLTFTLLLAYGKFRKFSWDSLHEGIINGIKPGIIPMIIFIMIGVLVASWLSAGVIPTIMVYGLEVMNPNFFLLTVFISCCLVGIIVGSAFTTISTMGLVFIGISQVMGIDSAMTVGAVVSGAFFGNNMSPLSDTTNLTTGIAGVKNLSSHIKLMSHTSLIAAGISAVIFFIIGQSNKQVNLSSVHHIENILKSNFVVSPLMLLPILVLLILAIRQVPAIPTLLSGAITAIIMNMIINGVSLKTVSDEIMNGFHFTKSTPEINQIVSGGGISNMLGSISLIICALALGGILLELGVIDSLISKMETHVNTPGKLILATGIGGIGVNVLVGEQYLSIILPGTTFKKDFEKLKIAPRYLSRTLATAGADINALVPWSVSGVFIAGTLGVNTIHYLPYTFYTWLNPILAILFGFIFQNRLFKAGKNIE
ncbi:Na+/H+ antiporter NhaC [Companilactobacillus metriopterae]|uniref:Na+/H+ antiporter NhaC n=1 Tax=Companilactobacillus metriopterae TaxID=1909267 RepID=UPI00100A2D9B|nr:Na+/H+ antiporter NhaC [Companilactobacillus metriopterae]